MISPPAASLAPSHPRRDLFSTYSLDTLISGAARLRPQGIALCDRQSSVSFDLLAGQATALSRLLADSGLKPGERVLFIGGAEASLVIATIAALRGGFEPALAPVGLAPQDFAAYAHAIGAAALAGPTDYGIDGLPEIYFAAAAAAPSIRCVATLGPKPCDEALDLSADAILRYAASHPDAGLERGGPAPSASARIITFERASKAPVFHQQATLMAASLDFIARASIGRETPILSTLPPTSFAGLISGPLAALLSGATLYLDGPFDAAALLKRRDELAHAHLVIPGSTVPDFAQAEMFEGLASAVFLWRVAATQAFARPAALVAPCPLVDLYAIDETAAVSELRRAGTAVPPALAPHFIGFDDARLLTIEAAPQAGRPLACRGAAVTYTE